MCCPRCRSEYLMIKHKKGVERIRVYMTGLREYLCRDCDTSFRGPDRRHQPRKTEVAGNMTLTAPQASRLHT